MNITAVILAAGQGTRMQSKKPKVLHEIAGKPMVKHVMDQVKIAGIDQIVLVLGYKREEIAGHFLEGVKIAIQPEQLGTGHAVMQTENLIDPEDTILIVSGDTPLLRATTINSLIEHHTSTNADATVMSAVVDKPFGYGRVIRSFHNDFRCIVEEKDAQPKEKLIKEINSGIYCIKARPLFAALSQIDNHNTQNEYYLPDVLPLILEQGLHVSVCVTPNTDDIMGINDRVQLAEAARIMHDRINRKLMLGGITIVNPLTTYIDSDVIIGQDTIIYPGTTISAGTLIGEDCLIGPDTFIKSSRIGNRVLVEKSYVNKAVIEDDCIIGPFTYLRPETHLAAGVKAGDFVEIKNSYIGEGSKIPHLSYIGDATVGKHVNIGAGTITCNYDGTNKHLTTIEDDAFIGSNTNLVAPVTVGSYAVIGAGSTITKNVPAESLGLERAPQKIIKKFNPRNEEN